MGIDALSPKQQLTADTVYRLTVEHHFPPTLDEIAEVMGITKGTLQYHISALRKKSIITWNTGSARSIRVIDDKVLEFLKNKYPGTHNLKAAIEKFSPTQYETDNSISNFLEEQFDDSLNNNHSNEPEFNSSKTQIPILGSIAAGQPLHIADDPEEYLEPDSFFPVGCYALRVKGTSMIDALINDGDVVLIEPRDYAKNGDIVVALINSEASTLKRFFKQADGSIMLKPENRTMEPIIVEPTDTLNIQGIVRGVIRKII